MGRITGSASIETLVRVGIEKENGLSPDSKMIVLHDFTPCVDDELEVKQGNVVNVLYQENDWVYVIGEDQREGFIPHSYCAPYTPHLGEMTLTVKKKLPRDLGIPNTEINSNPTSAGGTGGGGGTAGGSGGGDATNQHNTTLNSSRKFRVSLTKLLNKSVNKSFHLMSGTGSFFPPGTLALGDGSDNESYGTKSIMPANSPQSLHQQPQQQPSRHVQSSSTQSLNSQLSHPDIHPFFKDPSGRYIVLYTFIARDENDVSVERGEFVTVLNREDPDWYWVVRSDGQEGFVPSAFVYPAEAIQSHVTQACGSPVPAMSNLNNSNNMPTSPTGSDDMRYHGTELVMLYDYKAQAPDDLSVRRGDWVYADLNNQTVDGWLWAFAPKSRKYGFIPKAYARPPAMTSL
nr:EOG090X083C [Simocephalus serrulatus]